MTSKGMPIASQGKNASDTPASRTPKLARMTLATRRATGADLDALVPLFDGYRQFYGQPSDPARARDFLQARLDTADGQPGAIAFLATLDGAPAGFTLLYPMWSSVATGRIFVLNDLFVAPAARRQGVAQALLAAAREFGREHGALRLVLETTRDNLVAQALYHRAGWQAEPTQWFQLPLPDWTT